jgi:hypothetical protein
MRKYITLSIVFMVALFCIGTFTFIRVNNDHKECRNVTKYSVGSNGEKITTTKHLCKEKYNF